MNTLHVAVYGHVSEDTGSSPSGYYLLLDKLLERGVRIDFYAIKDFVNPQGLMKWPHFRYLPHQIRAADAVFDFFQFRFVPRRAGRGLAPLFNHVRMFQYYRRIESAIYHRHRLRPYDALLVLDLLSPFSRFPTLPCI